MVLTVLACIVSTVAGGDDTATDRLIEQLASVDPRVRGEAEQALLTMGESARAPLRRATKSSDPAIASAAADILQRLPWTRPDDPPAVRELLGPYGELDEEERAGVVARLLSLESGPAVGPLLRIAALEQNPEVAWQAVAGLRTRSIESLRRQLAEMSEDDDSAPLLALRGWALVRTEPDAALRSFARCAERVDEPLFGVADSEIRLVLRVAAGLAADLGRPALANDLRRRRVALPTHDSGDAALALAELLAGHVRVGADAELHRDMALFQSRLHDPRVLYVLAESAERRGHGSVARGLRALADATMPLSPTTPLEVGDLLLEQGWDATARTLLVRLVRSVGGDDKLTACNAELRLSRLARSAKRYAEAADHLERAFRDGQGSAFVRTDRLGSVEPWTDEQIELEIEWLRLADARHRNDAGDIDRRLDAILPRASRDSEVALEVLSLLYQRQRNDEAKRLFADARAELEKTRQLKPDDPGTLNNVAWFLARSGMAPEEALPIAQRAVELAPNVSGYLDTLAEAQFRLGLVEDAIRTETRALELRPDDAFMLRQLERFRTTRPDRVPLPSD